MLLKLLECILRPIKIIIPLGTGPARIGLKLRPGRIKSAGLRLTTTVLGVILVVIGLGSGCRSQITKEVFQREALSDRYLAALYRWTDEEESYQSLGLDQALRFAATYKSTAFRRAYVEEYSRLYGLTAVETEKMLADQLVVAGDNIEFILTVAGPTRRERDLDSRNSPWRIYLEGCQPVRMEPFEIRRVTGKSIKLERFFPFISPWSEVYEIRFIPPGEMPSSRQMQLVITGILGTTRLIFNQED